MSYLEQLIESGTLFDFILVAIAVEIIALKLWLHNRRGAISWSRLLPNLVAGALLMLAVKLAIVGAPYQWLAAVLALSLIAHIFDLRQRLRPSGTP